MRNSLIYISVILCTVAGWSQSVQFSLDYTVDYLIQNNQTQSQDTISIGYSKSGKYLWTNYNALAQEMAAGLYGTDSPLPKGASNMIYNSSNGQIYLIVELGSLNLFMNMEIAALLPGANEDNAINENVSIEYVESNKSFAVKGKQYPVFDVYADTEPQSSFEMAIDPTHPVDNNYLFNSFLELMLKATLSNGAIKTNLPNGIILSIKDPQGNNVIEAISIDSKPKKINLTTSFNISE